MTDNRENRDYEVGYKRPPVENQFKPGQSGNPKGRKKLIKDFKTDLREELEEIIIIQEGRKEKPITKQRALLKKLLAKAFAGELGALRALLNLIAAHLADSEAEIEELSAEERALLKKHLLNEAQGENGHV